MLTYVVMVTGWAVGDLILLWWSARLLRGGGWRRAARWGAIALASFQLVYVVTTLFGTAPDVFPVVPQAAAYAWHLLVLPVSLVVWAATLIATWAVRRFRRGGRTGLPKSVDAPDGPPSSTRRQFLRASAGLAPMFATAAITAGGVASLHRLRTRRLVVDLPDLPNDLDGFTIAHVTDLHIGRFLPAGMAERVADEVNALDADLVAFTGDLNDLSAPDLRQGIDFVRRLSARHGVYLVEGNHDVMPDADRFEKTMLDAGARLLLDQAVTLAPNGPAGSTVQLLGITWGELRTGRELDRIEVDTRFRVYTNETCGDLVKRVAAERDARSFPILLAHHPHAFDFAAQAGLPLTLAGHTHGGQLMLTDRVGVGPMRFRYWSGHYRNGNSNLVVSNGVGNWFPLRVNAPQEIVLIQLRRTQA